MRKGARGNGILVLCLPFPHSLTDCMADFTEKDAVESLIANW